MKKIPILILVGVLVILPLVVLAQKIPEAGELGSEAYKYGLGEIKGKTGLGETENVYQVINNIITVILGFLGLIAVIIVLYGGFIWMTSGGSQEKITKAKGLLTNGVVGLIIIILAYAIASFVINQLSNATGLRIF